MSSRVELRIVGMDCAEEVSLLRRHLEKMPGVHNLAFDVFQGRMTADYDPALISVPDLQREIASLGLKAEGWTQRSPTEAPSWLRAHGRQLLVAASGLFLAAGIAIEARDAGDLLKVLLVHEAHISTRLDDPAVISFLLAIVAGMAPFLRKALLTLGRLQPDMNALVLIAAIGAGVLGEWIEGGMLAFLYGLSGLLESWSVARARHAIGSLVSLAPAYATVVHRDHDHTVPVDTLTVGDTVRVKPGERIPCDGDVLEGSSFVNQSLITGESIPAGKGSGDKVFAGTLNGDGTLEVRVTRPASDTTIARIIRMVEDSQHRRAPTERFIDRVARVYTPVMVLVALLVASVPPLLGVGAWSHWFYQGMLILLISCPCALVISTPVTIVSALVSAARNGVLIKGGAHLEEAARLRAIAFDKTGVLTMGEPEVCEILPTAGHTEEEVLERLAAMELRSEHPLALAIARYAESRKVVLATVRSFQAIQGRGALAEIGGHTYWVGNQRLLEERGLFSGALRAQWSDLDRSGHTIVAFGSGRDVWAILTLADSVRPEGFVAIEELKSLGLEHLLMLTGDTPAAARRVAEASGLEDFRAGLLPDDKAQVIEELKDRLGHVAMVGDGVNDAQAMLLAPLGVALGGKSTDIALENSEVVLMADDLRALPFLIRHARRAVRVIQENVVVAIGMKLVFLVLALAGAASLWMAVVADMGGTLLVTLNGMRLLRARGSRLLPGLATRPNPALESR